MVNMLEFLVPGSRYSETDQASTSIASRASRSVDLAKRARRLASYRTTDLGKQTSRNLKLAYRAEVGETGVVIGNGPSLKQTDLERIADLPTILLNRGYLLGDRLPHHISGVCAHDPDILGLAGREITAMSTLALIPFESRRLVGDESSVAFLQYNPHLELASRIGLDLHHGHTAMFWGLQLALHLGWKRILIIGMDHNFVSRSAGEVDANHFVSDYVPQGVEVKAPDLQKIERSYALAQKFAQSRGLQILDCTPGGKCTVFERRRLERVV